MTNNNAWAGIVAGTLLAASAGATTFAIDGVVETCNPLACALVGIEAGDPVGGFMVANTAVSGPNSTFTDPDIPDYLFTIDTLSVGPEDASFDTGTFTTDSAGEIESGTASIVGDIDGTPVTLNFDIVAGAGSFDIEASGFGTVVTGAFAFSLAVDTDADDVADFLDNCQLAVNPDQTDVDGDQIGNACDSDLNNDCMVNFGDLALFKAGFLPVHDPVADFDGDGLVNFSDLAFMKQTFFNGANPGPGPGLPGNACD